MANPKLYVGDLAEATYTMSEAENASYPLSNLKTYIRTELWKSSNDNLNQTLNIDFGSAIARDFCIVDKHNFASMVDVRLEVDQNDSATFANPVLVAQLAGSANPGLSTFAATSKRYWRIKFTDNNTAIPELGQVFINKMFDTGVNYDFPYRGKDEEFETSKKTSLTGIVRTAQAYAGRLIFGLKWTLTDDTFRSAFQRFLQKVRGSLCPFYFADVDGTLWYVFLDSDFSPIDVFRYGLNNPVPLTLKTQEVHQNPLT